MACIAATPPAYGDIIFEKCEGFEACLNQENAGKLFVYLVQAQIYMTDWHIACGKKEK